MTRLVLQPTLRPIYQKLPPKTVGEEVEEEELPYDELCWGKTNSSSAACQSEPEEPEDDEPSDCERVRGYSDSSIRKALLEHYGCQEDDPEELQHFDEVSRVTQNWKIMDSGNETLYAIDQRINSIIFQKRDQISDETGFGDRGPNKHYFPPKPDRCGNVKERKPDENTREPSAPPPPTMPNKIQFNYSHPAIGEPMGGEGDTGGGPPPNDPPPPGTPPA